MIYLESSDTSSSATIEGGLYKTDVLKLQDCNNLYFKLTEGCVELDHPLELPRAKKILIEGSETRLCDLLSPTTYSHVLSLGVSKSPNFFDGFDDIANLLHLRDLSIRNQELCRNSKCLLSELRELKSLSLTNCDASDEVLLSLQCTQTLRRLDLYQTEISFSAPCLEGLVFSNVRSLDVSQAKITSTSLEQIQCIFPKLKRFICTQNELSIEDFRCVRNWDDLVIFQSGFVEIDFDNVGQMFWDD